jgi:acetyl-CoA acetyltransferase
MTTTAAGRDPVIVGIGTSDLPRAPHLDNVGHHVQAMQRALADAGVEKSAIEGYCCAGGSKTMSAADDMGVMVEYLGLEPRFTDGTMTGGSSFELHVEHAAAALRTGLCDTVLVTYGSDQLSRMGRQLGTRGFFGGQSKVRGPSQYEAPYGGTIVASYALAAARHMHEFGTTPEQLASIAVAARAHAAANPEALYREPITVDDVLASPMVSDPLHRLDSCVISDGGGALVLTTTERAVDLPGEPVAVLSSASAQTHWNISAMRDFTTTAATGVGRDLFARAGLTAADVDVLECYDSFTITVLLLLEDLGFCEKGSGGAFAASGAIGPGGSLPVNTDGGGLSAVHPGMRGIFLVIEAVRQLRGTSCNQVPGCEVALACGVGGLLSCIGAVLLGRAG